ATVGGRVSASRVLPGFATPGEADYSRGVGLQFAALRAPFIAGALGQTLPGEVSRTIGTVNSLRARAVSSFLGTLGAITVSHPFTNDNFARAYSVPSIPFTARTTTTRATRERGEPS